MIFRVQKSEKNFTVVQNQCLQDPNLSAKAKGIWAYSMTLPEDWVFYAKELGEHFTDGTKSLRGGLQELEREGYLARKRVQGGWEWTMYEVRQKKREMRPDAETSTKLTPRQRKCREIAIQFLDIQSTNWPKRCQVSESTITTGMKEIEKLCRIDQFKLRQVKSVLLWCAKDTSYFWNKNLYTLSTVRKKCKNEQTKFQNIFNDWEDKFIKPANIQQQAVELPKRLQAVVSSCPCHGEREDKERLVEFIQKEYKKLPTSVKRVVTGGDVRFIERYWGLFNQGKGVFPHCKNLMNTSNSFWGQFINKMERELGLSFSSGTRK